MTNEYLIEIIADEICKALGLEGAGVGMKKVRQAQSQEASPAADTPYFALWARPVHDDPKEEAKARYIEALHRMQAVTPARIGIGRTGPRLKTETLLRFRADHAAARDSVMKDVDPALLEKLGLPVIQTKCRDMIEYLTRPDLGRLFDEQTLETLKKTCVNAPQVQLYAAGGLSSKAVEANLENILPAIMDGLAARHISVGTPFYVRFARVASMDVISEALKPEVICVLIGERPGLNTAESMSAYIAYHAEPGMLESRRTVVSNIHKGGIPAVEAGAYIADVIAQILQEKASGVDLRR